jgi:fibronectin type 3 domain-containing protein
VAIGVFDASWSQNYSWNGAAAIVTVTAQSAPAAPAGLTATAGNAQIVLAWRASSGAASYNVYRGTAAGGEAAAPIRTGLTTAAFTDTGLTNGTKYFYKVAAVNATGTSGTSNEASATPQPPVPAVPAGLTASSGDTQVTLAWKASGGAATYNIYRATAAGGEGATPIRTGLTATSFTDTIVTNGTRYFYKVAAVNASGTSGLSNEVSATPHGAVPAAPQGLIATPGHSEVSLSWTAVTGAVSYNIYRGTVSGREASTPIKTNVTAAVYSDAGLANGVRYYYKVAAVNTGGTGSMSNEASARPR